MTDPLLAVEGLRVSYPARDGAVVAVDGASFTLDRGEVFGLVGASGCGKSSVIGSLAGLLPSTAALTARRMELGGTDLIDLDERGWQRLRGSRVGLVPQQPMTALTPTVAVGKQLCWYLGQDSIDRHEEALRRIGLDDVVDRPGDLPSRFSGGQLQRLLIAINTLDGHPDLLLADEPTSTLDATVQDSILGHLAVLKADHDMAMVLVSHDLAVVARLADRVGVMHGGELVEVAPVDELFDRPRHPATRSLVDAVPRVRPGRHGRRDVGIERGERPDQASPSPTTDATTAVDRPPVLEVERLYHYYGRQARSSRRPGGRVVRAVDDVSLEVAEGEVVAMVGESGSGKSTVARAVVGAIVPTAGTIRLDGRDVTAGRTQADRRNVQLVTQNPRAALNPRRRVGHALEQAQRVHGLGADAAARHAASARLMGLVHLPTDVLDRRPSELSGGELARVVLARALLLEPRLLLLDEPTASLDAPVRSAVLSVIGEIAAGLKLATLIITHELATARTVSDRVVVMKAGEVVETGPVDRVLEDPTHDYTRALLASEPQLTRR